MFANFLKVTIRNLYREKMYAVINIFGLSLAIACCIILGLYLHSELTYDRHNTKYKQIFRVVNEFNANGKINTYAMTSPSLGPMLAEDYPEIKSFVRIKMNSTDLLLRHGDKAIYWNNTYFADDNVFSVFTHKIIYGDPKTALIDPASVAISESFAKKYFGNSDPIGETITDDNETYKITLVFADLPENSHLKYDVLFSYNQKKLAVPDNVTVRTQSLFNLSGDFTYLLMPEGYNIQDFKKISDSFFNRHMAEFGKSVSETWRCWLQPLADIHLKSDVGYDQPTGNRFYIFGYTAVALFILLIACINYINLATARAIKRAKEVGMRKILGAGRISLILQFLCESIFFSMIAVFFAVVFVELASNLTSINELLNKPLLLKIINEPKIIVWILFFGLFIGLMSGAYPALYLSSILPLSVLVKINRYGKGGIYMRESLVLVQFIITSTVIACTLLMSLQMYYISKKPLGFERKDRIFVNIYLKDLINKISTIKTELLKNSNILGISTASNMVGQNGAITVTSIDNNDGALEKTTLKWMVVDDDYLTVMGMTLTAGRDFSKKLLTDVGTNYIVNETLVKKWAGRNR